ncbi:MAG TPA: DarT ssDNA thymidine ADP-ribosyltransferase family protein [Nostocaceae cyanobacterium]|nr:DarT ssDNA thymidine ADP-ribosyltransferase family protein [Nostocaceae cyanobacterium]
MTISAIQDIIDYSDLQINENQKVTKWQVIDKTTRGSKKVTIFVIQSNKIRFLVAEQELEFLSDILNQLSEEGKLDWQHLFDQKQPVNLYPSAFLRPDAHDAEDIKNFVRARGINHLVHFTCIENLYGICKEGAILGVAKLKELKCPYQQIDDLRIDGKLKHIFCSITYYNFPYHYLISYKSSCWVLLHIKTDYMWKDNTLFCTTNAATEGGAYLGKGLNKLQSLFEQEVYARRGIQTRFNKPDNLPTNIQAEVLVYESISLEDVIAIIVKNSMDVEKVRNAGWEGEIKISPDLFQPRFDWIRVKTNSA